MITNYEIKYAYINGKPIQYKLIYEPIREVKIGIYKNEIIVITSKKLENYAIEKFVPMHIEKYAYISNKKEQHASISSDLNKFRILEKYFSVKSAILKKNKKYEIIGNIIYLNSNFKKDIIIRDVYNDIVAPYVKKRLKYWQIKMGLAKYKIDLYFTWNRRILGTCSSAANNQVRIEFSNRIFSYGKKHIDCIIVHELSHIVHFHHQKSFWQHVIKYIPNYYVLHKQIIWT